MVPGCGQRVKKIWNHLYQTKQHSNLTGGCVYYVTSHAKSVRVWVLAVAEGYVINYYVANRLLQETKRSIISPSHMRQNPRSPIHPT